MAFQGVFEKYPETLVRVVQVGRFFGRTPVVGPPGLACWAAWVVQSLVASTGESVSPAAEITGLWSNYKNNFVLRILQ